MALAAHLTHSPAHDNCNASISLQHTGTCPNPALVPYSLKVLHKYKLIYKGNLAKIVPLHNTKEKPHIFL